MEALLVQLLLILGARLCRHRSRATRQSHVSVEPRLRDKESSVWRLLGCRGRHPLVVELGRLPINHLDELWEIALRQAHLPSPESVAGARVAPVVENGSRP